MTFQKENAEQAMNFYIELFENSEIIELKRWEAGGPVKEGLIMHATFSLNGKPFMCSDSPPVHDWDFTPAVSNFVECKDENELKQLFTYDEQRRQIQQSIFTGDNAPSYKRKYTYDEQGNKTQDLAFQVTTASVVVAS